MKKIFSVCYLMIALCAVPCALIAAVAAKPKVQSVISSSTGVRQKVAPSGLYSQECYDAYYGCMDQFCVGDSIVLNMPGEEEEGGGPKILDGGTCACSDENRSYKDQITKMNELLAKAITLETVEVDKVKAGAMADIIYGDGTREYDKDGNVVTLAKKEAAANNKPKFKPLYDDDSSDYDVFEGAADLSSLFGSALYDGANELCLEQVPDSCQKDLKLLTSLYSTQIKSDCKAFGNTVAKMQPNVDAAYAAAEKAVRDARLEEYGKQNENDLGGCMVAFKKCMMTEDACGPDWDRCVGSIASENMQNKKPTKDVSKEKVKHVTQFTITDSTMEIIDSKRNICEKVLNTCIAVRDDVWPHFLREVAPDLKLAELGAESKRRQSCLTDISSCIQKACKDDIAGTGKDTMDSCLSRPEMARSFCKNQIETCERMEPLIWGYVKDKLAAMRVDRCTEEVKECFTSPDRCGPNFENCIGMDYEYMHDMCPLDKLVVCKQNRKDFSMDDLDSMLMGLYLNMDNAALDNCQNLVNAKMEEVCGSTTDCNRFAADEFVGTGSLQPSKEESIYRITGMISFGSIAMGDASGKTEDFYEKDGSTVKKYLAPGEIGIDSYLAELRKGNKDVPGKEAIISTIEAELKNIAGTINRVITMIEQDPKVQFCVEGRDLSQINGKENRRGNNMTTARFPNMLNSIKLQIAVAALRKANDNYNAKLNKEIAEATKNASLDVAEFMCQRIPFGGTVSDNYNYVESGDRNGSATGNYAISMVIGDGISTKDLVKGATSRNVIDTAKDKGAVSEGSKMAGLLHIGYSGNGASSADGGIMREVSSIFSRTTRTCHICGTIVTKSCSASGGTVGFLGIGSKEASSDCKMSEPNEKCEDIVM